mgnify:CR=1 FL=1
MSGFLSSLKESQRPPVAHSLFFLEVRGLKQSQGPFVSSFWSSSEESRGPLVPSFWSSFKNLGYSFCFWSMNIGDHLCLVFKVVLRILATPFVFELWILCFVFEVVWKNLGDYSCFVFEVVWENLEDTFSCFWVI